MLLIFLLNSLKIFELIYIFQIKEYRFDRMNAFFHDNGFNTLIFFHKFKLPAITPRNILLVISSYLFLFFYLFLLINSLFILLFISVFIFPFISFFLVSLSVLLTNIISNLKKQTIISAAEKKIKNSKAVFIGITGSYGKSTTKEFLYKILSEKFKVAKTDENMNTDLGVALSIIKNLKKDTEYFIAEIGAYKIGEIKDVCNLINPKYGILTSIGNQHLDLFGNRQNLIQAKSELIQSLPKNGKAYINSDFPEFEQVKKSAKCPVVPFSTNKLNHFKRYLNETSFLGKHNLLNLLPCISFTLNLGVEKAKIIKAVKNLKNILHKLSVHKGINGSTILDDSYNSNLEGFLAAIETSKLFPQKNKIVVSQRIIELGEERKSSYQKIIETLNKSELVLYTNDKLFKELGVQKINYNPDLKELVERISKISDKSTLIIIEGKFPYVFIKQLLFAHPQ